MLSLDSINVSQSLQSIRENWNWKKTVAVVAVSAVAIGVIASMAGQNNIPRAHPFPCVEETPPSLERCLADLTGNVHETCQEKAAQELAVKCIPAESKDREFCQENFDQRLTELSERCAPYVPKPSKYSQERIDGMGWSAAVRANPPNPEKDIHLDSGRVKAWVDTHEGPYEKSVAAEVIDKTRLVCRSEFDSALESSVESFEKSIGDEDYIAVVDRPGKSNLWVFEKALSYLRKLPVAVDVWDSGTLGASLDRFPNAKHIMITDDASYTCSQIRMTERRVFNRIRCGTEDKYVRCSDSEAVRNLDDYTVHLVVPFMGKDCQYVPCKGTEKHIESHVTEYIPRIQHQFDRSVNCLYPGNYEMNRQLLFLFSHKVADYVSIPHIFEYGQAAGNARNANRSLALVKERPIPPYKTEGYREAHRS